MTLRRLLFTGSWFTALVLSGGLAQASVTFPPLLQAKLGLDEVPYAPLGCQLCHSDDKGGPQTATKPFGRAVLRAGAVGGNPPSMLAALGTLETDGTDSDFDGVPDIAELRSGEDPNVPADGSMAPAPEPVPLPQTGCTLSDHGAASGGGGLALLCLGALTWRRRRSGPPVGRHCSG